MVRAAYQDMLNSRVRFPWAVGVFVLAIISLVEYAVMRVLPLVLPDDPPRLVESLVDSVILGLILAPVLWWAIVRPLQHAAAMRERFVAELFATIEDERRRIAHELHDDVGQTLTLIISGLRSADAAAALPDTRRQSLEELAERALADVKQLALGLRPSMLDDLGLAPAMERIAGEMEKHHPLEVNLDMETLAGIRLPPETETALFRIFQEALNNVIKHSHAQHASVILRREPGGVRLEITDDGCGIDPGTLQCKSLEAGHMGIVGMRERAYQLGGTLLVDSHAGRGARISAYIPFKAAPP